MNTIQVFFLGILFDVEWEEDDDVAIAMNVEKNSFDWTDILAENIQFEEALNKAIIKENNYNETYD